MGGLNGIADVGVHEGDRQRDEHASGAFTSVVAGRQVTGLAAGPLARPMLAAGRFAASDFANAPQFAFAALNFPGVLCETMRQLEFKEAHHAFCTTRPGLRGRPCRSACRARRAEELAAGGRGMAEGSSERQRRRRSRHPRERREHRPRRQALYRQCRGRPLRDGGLAHEGRRRAGSGAAGRPDLGDDRQARAYPATDHVVIVPWGTDSSDFGTATRVYWTFKYLGDNNVSILDGGWRQYDAAGGARAATPARRAPATFVAHVQPQLRATTADVEAALGNGTPLIDARPTAQFEGKVKSPADRVAGTLARRQEPAEF